MRRAGRTATTGGEESLGERLTAASGGAWAGLCPPSPLPYLMPPAGEGFARPAGPGQGFEKGKIVYD